MNLPLEFGLLAFSCAASRWSTPSPRRRCSSRLPAGQRLGVGGASPLRATVTALLAMLLFSWAGGAIFSFFHITVPGVPNRGRHPVLDDGDQNAGIRRRARGGGDARRPFGRAPRHPPDRRSRRAIHRHRPRRPSPGRVAPPGAGRSDLAYGGCNLGRSCWRRRCWSHAWEPRVKPSSRS